MQQYILPVQIRWSDLDANAHLRHSVYYDWGSYCRIAFLNEQGLSTTNMHELHIGPISATIMAVDEDFVPFNNVRRLLRMLRIG